MDSFAISAGPSRRLAARSAAAMYAAAASIGTIEAAVLGSARPDDYLAAALAGLTAIVLGLFGERFPIWCQWLFAPCGTLLVGVAITTQSIGEGMVIYMWPIVYAAFFFSYRTLIVNLAWTAAIQAVVVWGVQARADAFAAWFDVVWSAIVVGVVISFLRARNDGLVARLGHEARTDSLTGLLNLRAFREQLEAELVRSRRGEPLALAIVDADHFKAINDARGHAAGDEVLARLAGVLRDQARGMDTVARIGGEEFAVLLPGGGEEYAERVHAALAEVGELTVSIGVATSEPGTDGDALLRHADDALYAAKRGGRNRTVVAQRTS